MAKQKESTKKIIKLLTDGKTQWEVHKLGYPFGTVRYHYQKMFKPKQFAQFMVRHKARMKLRAESLKKKLSTKK